MPFLDGRWWTAHATITNKPPWLKEGTGASMEFLGLWRMELNGWDLVRKAIVKEVTVTSPTHEPTDPDAQVVTLRPADEKPKPNTSPAARALSNRPSAGEHPLIHRQPSNARHAAEEAELHRRLDWLEKHTGRHDLEAVLQGRKRELYGPSLHDQYPHRFLS